MSKRPKTPTKKPSRGAGSKPAKKTQSPPRPAATAINPSKAKRGAASKRACVIAMLQSPGGATIAAMTKETRWQPHSVRGFLAGVVRKRLKLKLVSAKVGSERVYRIEGESTPKASNRRSGQSSA